jgi:TPR repeat protein
MFSLGRIAFIERDFKDALTWFNRAVSAGHARSLYYIGSQHWHGQRVPQDKKEAMNFFSTPQRKK